jgi:cyclopropane fatty-acyl-phospholipid synthase-like methyltransferase
MKQYADIRAPAQVRPLTWREWRSRLWALARCQLPMLMRRPTVAGVAAYFDLVTDDTRLFFGDSFHLGYFATGDETLPEALTALTDLVTKLARVMPGSRVLDLGCGIGAPAARIADRHHCRVIGVNISLEQIRQGRVLVQQAGLADRIDLRLGNALTLDVPDASVDCVICLEAAGNICITASTEARLVSEIWRVLKPGGHVGFCDFVLAQTPTRRERRALRTLFYEVGLERDWPTRFREGGFEVLDYRDIHAATLPTWDRALDLYALRASDFERRYGKAIARRSVQQVREMAPAIVRCGSYPAFRAEKPAD